MKIIFAALIQILAYVCLMLLAEFTPIAEGIWQILALITLPAIGYLSVKLFGRDGITGNVAALLIALCAYAIYSYDKDALWIIGLFMIPGFHILEFVSWIIALNLNKKSNKSSDPT